MIKVFQEAFWAVNEKTKVIMDKTADTAVFRAIAWLVII